MKSIIIIWILFLCSNLSFAENVIKVQLDDSDITINENGEVIIDGVKYSEEVIERVVENNLVVSSDDNEDNIYRSKNVDGYNKWYNKNKNKIKSQGKNRTKKIIFTILGVLGSIGIFISLIMIIRGIIRNRVKKSKDPKVNPKPDKHELEVIGSAIKNDNKAISGSTGPNFL